MQYRAHMLVAWFIRDVQLVHELIVADGNVDAVQLRRDAVPADLRQLRDAAAVNMLSVGFPDADGNGMGGEALHVGRILQELCFVDGILVHRRDGKIALGDRTGLVEGNDLDLRERLQIVRALDQNALVAGAAQAGEEAQRDGNDEGAGAGYDKQSAGAQDPLAPYCTDACASLRHENKERRQDGQRQCHIADDGGIVFREL